MKRVMAALGAAVLAVVVASCGGGGTSEDPTISPAGGNAGGCAVAGIPGASLSISAENLSFSTACLSAAADQQLTITFENKESVPHNVAILKPGSTDLLFTGQIVTGPKTVTYTVPPLTAGRYKFECTVHPSQMKGTLVVR